MVLGMMRERKWNTGETVLKQRYFETREEIREREKDEEKKWIEK